MKLYDEGAEPKFYHLIYISCLTNGHELWVVTKLVAGSHISRIRDYIVHLAWEYLGISQENLENVAGERDACTTFLSLWLTQAKSL